MFAVIRTGGKQYRVSENDRLEVEKLTIEPGATVRLDDVLMIGGDDCAVQVGAPVLDAAAVFAEVVEHKRDAKVLVFKKRRRKNSRRLRGHRQLLTVLRITGISDTGEAPVAAETPVVAESAQETATDAAVAESVVEPPEEAAIEPDATSAAEPGPSEGADDTVTADAASDAAEANASPSTDTPGDESGAADPEDETKKD